LEQQMARDVVTPADDDDEPTALEDAFVRYQENGLRLPPVPRDLVDELDEFADWRWGSEDLNLEDRDGFVDAARQAGGERVVAFGHVGHGVSSWWLCYLLKLDALAVYVRLAYGGVYEDAAAVVPEINEVSAALEELIPAAEAAKKAGRFRGGHRLIVVVDDKQAGFWEVAGGPDGRQRSRDPLGDAMGFLSQPVLSDPPT
jgi:hypothetical protein